MPHTIYNIHVYMRYVGEVLWWETFVCVQDSLVQRNWINWEYNTNKQALYSYVAMKTDTINFTTGFSFQNIVYVLRVSNSDWI